MSASRTCAVTVRLVAVITLFSGVTAACAPDAAPEPSPELTVDGLDYTFRLPDTLAAGPATLRFRNAGTVPHEMGMSLLKEGVSIAQVLAAEDSGSDPMTLMDGIVGILIAEPGQTTAGALAVDLLPGRTYMLWCNFQDGSDKPPHLKLGMFSGRTIAAR